MIYDYGVEKNSLYFTTLAQYINIFNCLKEEGKYSSLDIDVEKFEVE